jgi:hypothetical protein
MYYAHIKMNIHMPFCIKEKIGFGINLDRFVINAREDHVVHA